MNDHEATVDDDTLAAALARHAIELPSGQIEHLDEYCRLLWDWNAKMNLTRHTTYEKFVARDVVDTLQLAERLELGDRVLDVGSGGGVPGIPLAIVRPDLQLTLTESVAKKARVLADMVEKLQLPLTARHGRAEDVLKEHSAGRTAFEALIVRAVAPLEKLLRWFTPHAGQFDRLLVIKGPNWLEERAEARHVGVLKPFDLRKVAEWPLPDTEGQSVLLELRGKE